MFAPMNPVVTVGELPFGGATHSVPELVSGSRLDSASGTRLVLEHPAATTPRLKTATATLTMPPGALRSIRRYQSTRVTLLGYTKMPVLLRFARLSVTTGGLATLERLFAAALLLFQV